MTTDNETETEEEGNDAWMPIKPVAGSQFLGGGGNPEKFSKGEVFIVEN